MVGVMEAYTRRGLDVETRQLGPCYQHLWLRGDDSLCGGIEQLILHESAWHGSTRIGGVGRDRQRK